MNFLSATLARLVGLSACAALFLVEHVRLAWRARRAGPHRARRGVIALIVPGAGASYAWRDGARVAPVAYFALAAGYVALRYWR